MTALAEKISAGAVTYATLRLGLWPNVAEILDGVVAIFPPTALDEARYVDCPMGVDDSEAVCLRENKRT